MAIDLGDAVVSITGDDGGLTKTLGSVASKAGKAMTFAGGAITGALGLAARTAMQFEQAITDAASVTGKTGDEFIIARDKMAKLAKTLGRTTVFSAREAASAFWDLSSKGIDVANASVSDLQPLLDLAAATQFDLTGTTEIVTATMKGFGLEMKDSARIADVFVSANGMSAFSMDKVRESMKFVAPVARAMGVSLEETVAVLNSLFDSGMEGSMAGTALRGALMSLAKPTAKMTELSKKLSIGMDDMNPAKVGLTQALRNLSEAGITVQDVMQGFDRRTAAVMLSLLGLTDQGTETIDMMESMNKRLGEGTGKAAEVAALQLDTLSGQMKLVSSAWEGFILSFANEDVLSALKPMATGLAEIISKVTVWLETNPELARTIFLVTGAVGAAMLVLGPLLMVFGLLLPAVGVLASGIVALIATFGWLLVPIGIVIAGIITLGGVFAFWLVNKMRNNWAETVRIFEAGKRIVVASLRAFGALAKAALKVVDAVFAGFFDGVSLGWDDMDSDSKENSKSVVKTLEDFANKVDAWSKKVVGHFEWMTGENNFLWKVQLDAIRIFTKGVGFGMLEMLKTVIEAVTGVVRAIVWMGEWIGWVIARIWDLLKMIAKIPTYPGQGVIGGIAGGFLSSGQVSNTAPAAAASVSGGALAGGFARQGVEININANLQSGADTREMLGMIHDAVKRAVAGRGGYTIRGLNA